MHAFWMITFGHSTLVDLLSWVIVLTLGSKALATLALLSVSKEVWDRPGWGAGLWWAAKITPILAVPCFIWLAWLQRLSGEIWLYAALALFVVVAVPLKVRQRQIRMAKRTSAKPLAWTWAAEPRPTQLPPFSRYVVGCVFRWSRPLIPTRSRPPHRFEAGHHSDLMSAICGGPYGACWLISWFGFEVKRRGAERVFSEALAVEVDAVSVVNNAIEDSVGERWISDDFEPAVHRDLACDEDRAAVVAVLDDLEQIAATIGVKHFGPKIIDYQEWSPRQRAHHFGIASIASYASGEGRRCVSAGSGGLSERYVCVGLPVPWEQLGEAVLRDAGNASDDIGEPGLGVDVVELGGDDQRVHERGALATAIGADEQPRFPAEGDPANSDRIAFDPSYRDGEFLKKA
jgi:hypothetical protein